MFIATRTDKEKDQEDLEKEEEIRARVTQKHSEKHFQEDKDFRRRAAIYRYAVSIGFGILEDIPQLAIQTLNTILIGRTMKWI